MGNAKRFSCQHFLHLNGTSTKRPRFSGVAATPESRSRDDKADPFPDPNELRRWFDKFTGSQSQSTVSIGRNSAKEYLATNGY